ncbi:hypothetical protein CQA53_04325 [Helicobacter didelphidarum]|uniref:Membrane transport protein MMPL domain-containing protein n=1 Tax=Helicobacter didelphidarum TaxID=2040648 RepID=A0A3D8IM98_9HELI|nr:hypothetical protein [Helicobacter didelphidarum]RDU66243.1 hypothetical protein CQA53_04325 [Helicobacter didelphidarum]
MLRFINFILFFIAISCIVLFFLFQKDKITQEVLDLFPQTQDRQIIDIYQKFSHSRYILVAIKGFDEKARVTLNEFLDKIQSVENVQTTLTKMQAPQELQEFIQENYFYVALPKIGQDSEANGEFSTKILQTSDITYTEPILFTSQQISQTITKTLKSLESLEYVSEDEYEEALEKLNFNPYDPFGIFRIQANRPKILVAKDYGYMALVEMKSVEKPEVEKTLNGFEMIAQEYPNIRYFSPNFMGVKNLNLILSEVNFLLTFASLFFIALYFIIIRIPILTLNTICTLVVANVVAIFVVSSVYPKVTIMALSFGMGISNIAIDYMMHHNFFSLYSQNKRVFNRPVFYGYITTIVGFCACLFIPFPLLTQLSLYAIISLTICYVSFAFLYPRIGFVEPRLFLRMANLRFPIIPSLWFLFVSLILFIVAFMNVKLDFDLSKLDYQNKPMLQERDFFTKAMGVNETQILLSSQSIDGLIQLSKDLQKGIDKNMSLAIEVMKPIDTKEDSMNRKTFIPLSILPSKAQMEANKAFLESDTMRKNKETLLYTLPNLKTQLIREIKESMKNTQNSEVSLEDKLEFIDGIFDTFAQSYEINDMPVLNLEKVNELGFSIIALNKTHLTQNLEINEQNISKKSLQELPQEAQDSTLISHNQRFYYLATIQKQDLEFVKEYANALESLHTNTQEDKEQSLIMTKTSFLQSNPHIETRSLHSIMDHITDNIYSPMLIVLGIAFSLMVVMLLITAREAFLDSIVFILFPLSCALCVIASHSPLNIMHLFALLILVVVSIDYGIYSVKEGDNPRTAHAIFFSAITTGASFGVLIISKTKALNSFGEVIFAGMLCVLFMLVFHKVNQRKLS